MSATRKKDERPDPYMSVAAAARALGVSRPTVLARAGRGELHVEMIAGRPVVTRESVKEHLRATAA